ncbi:MULTISPECIES: ABC transporter substrate-binding protein [Mesorhizobium]|uniref:ABC transporter substrate-binding protein n=1 Tax=Mesorhizobium TaxID=68287 RepID=UPI001459FE03|nr:MULTISPECIES: ABC transporter substrate-binding protein [Mesorhizobium]
MTGDDSKRSHAFNQAWHLTRRHFLAGTAAFGAAAIGRVPMSHAATPDLPIGNRDPKTLVVVVDATVENLDPATNVEWAYGLSPIYETLTVLDGAEALKVKPSLAKAFTSSDDKMIWTFELPAGVKFHDGTDCDANAVKAAITRTITRPGGTFATSWQIDDPEKQIVVKNATTLEFHLTEARPFFDLEVSSQYGFWIASPTAAQKNSKGANDMGSEFLQSHPVGCGPYKMESFNPGQDITYVRFDEFHGGWDHPHFERVITKTIPVSATRRQLLEAGEVDIALRMEPQDTVELRNDPRFVIQDTSTATVQYVVFATDGKLADPRVRQAICHAFDHDSYLRDVVLGTADKPRSVFPSQMQGVGDESYVLPFDLEKAKALLAEANFPAGSELTVTYYSGFGDTECQLLQGWLSELGITLHLQEKSFSAFLDEFFGDAPADQRADLFYFSWWPNVDHPYNYAWSLFSGAATAASGNAGRYANDEVTKLIDELRQKLIDTEQAQKVKRLAQILTVENPAWLPIQQERMQFVARRDIKGMVNNPIYVATLDIYNLSRSA